MPQNIINCHYGFAKDITEQLKKVTNSALIRITGYVEAHLKEHYEIEANVVSVIPQGPFIWYLKLDDMSDVKELYIKIIHDKVYQVFIRFTDGPWWDTTLRVDDDMAHHINVVLMAERIVLGLRNTIDLSELNSFVGALIPAQLNKGE